MHSDLLHGQVWLKISVRVQWQLALLNLIWYGWYLNAYNWIFPPTPCCLWVSANIDPRQEYSKEERAKKKAGKSGRAFLLPFHDPHSASLPPSDIQATCTDPAHFGREGNNLLVMEEVSAVLGRFQHACLEFSALARHSNTKLQLSAFVFSPLSKGKAS